MRKFFFLGALLLSAVLVRADEVVLVEGKTLTGKILKEDDHEIFIHLGQNMFLHIDKSKIKQITRSQPDARHRGRIVTMATVQKSTTTTSPAAKASAAPEGPKLLNITEQVKTTRSENEGLSLVESVQYKAMPITGNNFAEANQNFEKFSAKTPTRTALTATWNGKAGTEAGQSRWQTAVIVSTITLTLPKWDAGKSVDNKSVDDWNSFIQRLEKHELGHADILDQSLRSFGEGLMKLRSATEADLRKESARLFDENRERAERRRQGFDRHEAKKGQQKPAK